MKKELGFSTYSALLNYTVLEITREGAIPPASYDQVFEKLGSRPVIITGQSGAGKSTCVKSLLSQFGGNVFVVDVAGEYTELKDVDLGKFFSTNWGKEDLKIRFIPNSNVEISKAEAAIVFSHLNFIKNSGALKDWCLVIEEGHRFGADPNLTSPPDRGEEVRTEADPGHDGLAAVRGHREGVQARPLGTTAKSARLDRRSHWIACFTWWGTMNAREKVTVWLRGARGRMAAAWSKHRRRIALWFALVLCLAALVVLLIALLAWVAVTLMNWRLIF